jgi:hypothetical protein
MKMQFFENKFGMEVHFIPETMEEVSSLARVGLNVKAEKPSVRVYFPENGTPSMSLWVHKVKETVQKNSIGN